MEELTLAGRLAAFSLRQAMTTMLPLMNMVCVKVKNCLYALDDANHTRLL